MIKISGIKNALAIGTAAIIVSCATSKNSLSINQIAKEQAEADSAFYRNIFNQTQAAKDSSAVADFNKIASGMKNLSADRRKSLSQEILKNAQENGADIEQTNIIKGVQYISNSLAIRTKQKLADSFVYGNLFKKYGITDKID